MSDLIWRARELSKHTISRRLEHKNSISHKRKTELNVPWQGAHERSTLVKYQVGATSVFRPAYAARALAYY